MVKLIILASVLYFGFNSIAQTGPGGVGSSANNALWLKANFGTSTTTGGAPISSWADASGNGNTVSQTVVNQQPLYTTTLMNGYPAIQFDNNSAANQNDYLTGTDNASLDNTNGLTIFSVIRPTNLGGARSIIAKRTNVGVNQAYMFFFFTSDYLYTDIVSNDNRFSTTPTAYAANINYIFNLHYDGTLAAGSRAKVYRGQALVVTATETATTIPDYNSPLVVGSTHIGDNRPFGGYMAEIIIYREALGNAERIIVDNYLSAKYDITIFSNNVYKMDSTFYGNFDHDVAGIGRESATDLNTDAQGSGIVRILNPNGLGNNEYLMWGHNNGILQAINTSDIPAAVDARFDRVWRASESSKTGAVVDVGGIDIRWDLTGLGPVTASDLRLLVDTDNDGIFSDETPISGATSVGGNVYQFANVNAISDQLRFTLATINLSQTPLPVELISFTAEGINNHSVALNWQTKSEVNNACFIVQHSWDGNNWEDKFTLPGAINSTVVLDYQQIDRTPYLLGNYYRLKQIDMDGNFVYSEIRYVNISAHSLLVFPNPASSKIMLTGFSGNLELVEIYNSLGQRIQVSDLANQINDSIIEIDISYLPSGVYYIQTSFGAVRFMKQ